MSSYQPRARRGRAFGQIFFRTATLEKRRHFAPVFH
jgi:hypothetical protein